MMNESDLFSNSIEQLCQDEPNIYFVWINDPRIKDEHRISGRLVPEVYEIFLLEIIVSLSSEERKYFLQKHYYSYEDRNIEFFEKLEELIEGIEFSEKEIFIKLINQHLYELESVKKMDFNQKFVHVLRKLSEAETFSFGVNIRAILGQEKPNSDSVVKHLQHLRCVSLDTQGLAKILPLGKSYLIIMEKIFKGISEDLQKQLKKLENLQKEPLTFFDWCNDTSIYLNLAKEKFTGYVVERYKKDFDNINIEAFKADISKRIMKIVDFIKKTKRLRIQNYDYYESEK